MGHGRNVFSEKPVWFFLAVLAGQVMGLDPQRSLDQYVHRRWALQDGLPQSSITALLQTRDGYLWIGTQNGLARFDGVTFTVFNRTNSDAFASDYITSLVEDAQGSLWVGTRNGLVFLQNGRFRKPDWTDRLINPVINVMACDQQGTLWIGTDGRGLHVMRDGELTSWVPSAEPAPNHVISLCPDGSGRLWVGCRKGLYCLEGSRCDLHPTFAQDQVRSIVPSTQDGLWVATYRGVFHLTSNRVEPLDLDGESTTAMVNAILFDSDGCLWIGTEGTGLNRGVDGMVHGFSHLQDATNDSVTAILEDREKNLWVGTYTGLHLYRDGKLTTFRTQPGTAQNVIWTVYQDPGGSLYLTTNDGLSIYEEGAFRFMTVADGLSSNFVSTTYRDHRNRLWIGTYDQGITILAEDGLSFVTTKNGLTHESIRTIVEDRHHTLWIATYGGGACRFDNGSWSHLTTKNGLTSDYVFALCESARGGMWIGTDGGGLNFVHEDGIEHFGTSDGLSSDVIMALYEDSDGVLWVGTEHDGLCHIQDDRCSCVTTSEGLAGNSVFQILEDDARMLWLSSYEGICCVSKEEIQALAAGTIDRLSSHAYDEADGMRSRECNGGFQPAGWKTLNGALWFATLDGAAMIDPNHIISNTVPPPVHIEKILLDGKPVAVGPTTPIPPTVHKVEFFYTALSFCAPAKIEFRYQLQGFDSHWVNPGKRLDRIATYTNLPPGAYTFVVIACNNDGVWNQTGDTCRVQVIAPFWRTPWFIVLAALLFAAFSYFAIHLGRTYFTLIAFWKRKSFIGHYRILEKIGLGGMGTVYKAQHVMDKTKTVAIKVIRESFSLDPEQKKRFLHEASIMDQFNHPHIVKVIERGEYNQQFFFAMEFLEGPRLSELIEHEHPIGFETIQDVLCQIADALAKIHSKGVVHRDLKPENIMLTERDGRRNFVKLLDFGLAKTESLTRFTETGKVMGTVQYISPEQILEGNATPASDMYALGVIFFELVTGSRPFDGETVIQTIKAILDNDPQPPVELRPDLPEAWNRLILNMIDKDPRLRPDAASFLKELKKGLVR